MEEKNKRKGIIYLTIGVVTLLILVAGATYAYFQAQTGNTQSANLNTTTGTTDVLSFLMSDINVTDENDPHHIIDEHNKEEGNENTEIVINANQDNFGKTNSSLGDGVSAKAILMANDNTKTAQATYNVYFVMDKNDLEYTKGEEYPELILSVIDPQGKEIESIPGLKPHKKDENNPNDVDGFDITGKTKAFAIAKEYEIEVKEGEGGQKEQEWKIKVTLVNFPDTDQNENTKKEITGRVVITTGSEEGEYTLAHINTITPETTSSSIEATLDVDEGTNGIKEYYFAIEKKGVAQTVKLSEKTKEEINNWQMETENHHTFNELDDNTNYVIYSYVVDSEGFESSLYETEIIATDIELPQITKVEVTAKRYNSITVEVKEKTEGSLAITSYEYEISGGEIVSPRVETETGTTHTFTELNELTEYTIKVRAVDSKENKSTNYEIKETTDKKACNEGETIGTCLMRLDKEQNPEEPALLLHNGTIKDTEGNIIDAEDNSYRYAGSNEKVKNYVCFGGECENNPNSEYLYRIIGLFKNSSDQYEMKIIKATPATSTQLGTEGAYYGSGNYYWNYSTTETEYDGYNTNDWSKSNLNTVNLNGYYLDTYLQGKDKGKWNKMIAEPDHTWTTVGNTTSNIRDQKVKEAYINEITSPSVGTALEIAATEVPAKVGLMYANDYGYAAYKEAWTTKTLHEYNDEVTKANNWMFTGIYEWTITRSAGGSDGVFVVNNAGYVNNNYTNFHIIVIM